MRDDLAERMLTELVKKILTKFAVAKKLGKSEGMAYRSPRIYLPTKLTDDSTFPFKEDDLITVRIDGRKLVVQRAPRVFTEPERSAKKLATRQKP